MNNEQPAQPSTSRKRKQTDVSTQAMKKLAYDGLQKALLESESPYQKFGGFVVAELDKLKATNGQAAADKLQRNINMCIYNTLDELQTQTTVCNLNSIHSLISFFCFCSQSIVYISEETPCPTAVPPVFSRYSREGTEEVPSASVAPLVSSRYVTEDSDEDSVTAVAPPLFARYAREENSDEEYLETSD